MQLESFRPSVQIIFVTHAFNATLKPNALARRQWPMWVCSALGSSVTQTYAHIITANILQQKKKSNSDAWVMFIYQRMQIACTVMRTWRTTNDVAYQELRNMLNSYMSEYRKTAFSKKWNPYCFLAMSKGLWVKWQQFSKYHIITYVL